VHKSGRKTTIIIFHNAVYNRDKPSTIEGADIDDDVANDDDDDDDDEHGYDHNKDVNSNIEQTF